MPRVQGEIMPMKGWTKDDVDRLCHDLPKHFVKPLSDEFAKPKRKAKVGKGAQQPNATEQEYAEYGLSITVDLRFQALTFHMKNGNDYTPDWIQFDCEGLPCRAVEVKGSHRFHSHGRARLAFNQCKIEFPGIEWIWATKTKEGWVYE